MSAQVNGACPRFSMEISVPAMKVVIAALLLMFQLQPLLGTAACLGLTEREAQQQCRMPEHGTAPGATLASSGSAAQGCGLASICLPAPLAIPSFATQLEAAVSLFDGTGLQAVSLLPGVSASPPFHPPRA